MRHGNLFIAMVLGLPALILAHPGHGETPGDSPVHYLLEPVHGVMVGAGVLVVVGAVMWGVRIAKKQASTRRLFGERNRG